MFGGQISLDLLPDFLLCPGEPVWQRFDQPFTFSDLQHRKAVCNLLSFFPETPDQQNKQEKFIEYEPLSRFEQRFFVRRKVHLLDTKAIVRKLIAFPDFLRKIFR